LSLGDNYRAAGVFAQHNRSKFEGLRDYYVFGQRRKVSSPC
jgi:hypothetical protein